MAPVLLVAGLAIASLPALGHPIGRRIAPAEWTKLCLVALLGGAVAVEAGAVLVAAPTVLRATGASALAETCNRFAGPLLPLGTAGGWLAAVVAVVVPALAVRGWRRSRGHVRALAIEGSLGRHDPRDAYELVVLPTPEPVAYSVAEPRPQVVVSQGLTEALRADELQALVAHERAHLRHRHPQLLLVAAAARAALALWPPANRSHAVLRAAVERWADDDATRGDPARRRSLRDALVSVVIADLAGPVAAFSLVDATIERVEAMERPPRLPLLLHVLLYVPGIAGAVVAIAAATGWAGQVRHAVAMVCRCTI